jgi:putative tricarboxylic transport membrane protein
MILRSYNQVSSLFWFLVGLGFTLGGFHYGFGTWHEPGPGLLPVVFGTLLGVLSIALFLTSIKESGKGETKLFWEMKGSWKIVFTVFLSLLLYMVFLKLLGFILITFFFIFFLLRFIGKKGWLISISVAILLSFSCYGLFSLLLGTPLPKGQIYGSAFRAVAGV